MRFSETPITVELGTVEEVTPSVDTGSVEPVGPDNKSKEGSGHSKAGSAAKLIESIGTEFSRLRKSGRANAWADLEDKVAKAGHILVPYVISAKDWVGMMIDIEQFRKSEGGNAEVPGDALAKWLSEGEVISDDKPIKTRKKMSK